MKKVAIVSVAVVLTAIMGFTTIGHEQKNVVKAQDLQLKKSAVSPDSFTAKEIATWD